MSSLSHSREREGERERVETWVRPSLPLCSIFSAVLVEKEREKNNRATKEREVVPLSLFFTTNFRRFSLSSFFFLSSSLCSLQTLMYTVILTKSSTIHPIPFGTEIRHLKLLGIHSNEELSRLFHRSSLRKFLGILLSQKYKKTREREKKQKAKSKMNPT